MGAGDDDDEEDENASGFHPTLDFVCWALALEQASRGIRVGILHAALPMFRVASSVGLSNSCSIVGLVQSALRVFICFFCFAVLEIDWCARVQFVLNNLNISS